ncbi:MAG: hypothetical protein HC933_00575 [Pleurocapsa sp. SU_196_0]|nr:hypothetical protein [Pleurocapsa sp. SU_196_0]
MTTFKRRDPYTRDQRLEINLVARAIARGDTIPDEAWYSSGTANASNPRQLAPDALSSDMIRAYMDEVRSAREAVRWLLAGEVDRASNFAVESARYAREHVTLTRQFERRTVTSSGRRNEGDTFTLEMDGVRFYFDLILVWLEDDSRLRIANALELQRAAHLPDLHSLAWDDLERWVTDTDLRARRTRVTEFDDQLVYREHKGGLELREPIGREYPNLPDALRAVALTLRSSVEATRREPRDALPDAQLVSETEMRRAQSALETTLL